MSCNDPMSARAALRDTAALTLVTGLCLLAFTVQPVRAEPAATGADEGRGRLPPVFVDLRAETWKPRGRVLFDVLAVVRTRLLDVGIPVVRSAEAPHELTLSVEYREEQGEPYDVMSSRTIITGRFLLQREGSSPLLDLQVQERTGENIGGTPPYVDAIQRFESNPSVYFLGDLVRERLAGDDDRTTALLQGLRRELKEASAKFDPLSAPHTMLESESTVPPLARQRAIREIARRGDVRAVPLLREYLSASDRDTSRSAREALARLAPSAVPERGGRSHSPTAGRD